MKMSCLILFLFFLSCKKEKNTFSDSFIKNNTSHTIKITPYVNGTINMNSTVEIQANEIKKVYYNNTRGLGKGVSYSRINQPMDSFVVTFDNMYSIVHYKSNLIGNRIKHYLYFSKRNLFNDSSYLSTIVRETKNQRSWEFIYTFVEKDFLDAQ